MLSLALLCSPSTPTARPRPASCFVPSGACYPERPCRSPLPRLSSYVCSTEGLGSDISPTLTQPGRGNRAASDAAECAVPILRVEPPLRPVLPSEGEELGGALQEGLQRPSTPPQPKAQAQCHSSIRPTRMSFGSALVEDGGKAQPPLLAAAAEGRVDAVQAMLLEGGAGVHTRDRNGLPPLAWAARCNQLGTMEALLHAGADVHAAGFDGLTPLAWAARAGNAAAVAALVAHGAAVTLPHPGFSPLHWAAHEGHADAIEELLRCGADADAHDASGASALHWAAYGNHAAAVAVLLQGGADKDASRVQDGTPLHWASRRGALGAIEVLLAAGADHTLRTAPTRDDPGSIPLALALAAGHNQAAELLRRAEGLRELERLRCQIKEASMEHKKLQQELEDTVARLAAELDARQRAEQQARQAETALAAAEQRLEDVGRRELEAEEQLGKAAEEQALVASKLVELSVRERELTDKAQQLGIQGTMQQGMLELLRQQEEHIAAAALRVRQQEAALGAREEVLLLAEAAISMKQADLAAREEQLAKEREALEQASKRSPSARSFRPVLCGIRSIRKEDSG